MNAGSAAAGYGYEYVASTLDRIRAAALAQSDTQLQMPIITPCLPGDLGRQGIRHVSEADMPEWGSAEERGIEMEITTAAACLARRFRRRHHASSRGHQGHRRQLIEALVCSGRRNITMALKGLGYL